MHHISLLCQRRALSVERRECRALKKIEYKIYQVLSTCRDLLTLRSLYMLTVGHDKSQSDRFWHFHFQSRDKKILPKTTA